MLLFVIYPTEGPHERKAVLEVFNTARGRRSEAALKTKGTVQSHRDRPLCFFRFFRDWRGRDSGFWSLFCKYPIKLEDLKVRPAEELKKKNMCLCTTGSNKDKC